MSDAFSFILNKKNEIEKHYDKFTKNFTTQLLFMEAIIRQDAKQLSQIKSCCSFLQTKTQKHQQIIKKQALKYNQNFYVAFNLMISQERQSYYLEVLEMISLLIKQFGHLMERRDKKREKFSQHQIKTHHRQLKDILLEKYINKAIENNMNQFRKSIFVIKAQIDGTLANKIVRFDNFTLILIQKVKKQETKIVIDLRNYIILKQLSNISFIYLKSIYSTIEPTTIKMQFLSISQRNLMIPHLLQITKIGKIQRLVLGFQLQKIIAKEYGVIIQAYKSTVMSSAFVLPVSLDQIEQNENTSIVWKNSLRITQQKKKLLYRKKSIRQSQYLEVKKRVIQILYLLAKQKKQQNNKINMFLAKQDTIKSKTKSTAIIAILKDQQSILFSPSVNLKNKDVQQICNIMINQQITREKILTQSVLKIMGKKQQSCSLSSQTDTFFSKDSQNRNLEKKDSYISQRPKYMHYYQNIYKNQFYSNHKLDFIDILIEYQHIQITNHIWEYTQQNKIMLNDLKGGNNKQGKHNQVKRKSAINNSAHRLNQNCKICQHKSKLSVFKIFIQQQIEVKFLVQAISNIMAWPEWHPNVQQVKLLSKNEEKNICQFIIIFKINKDKYQTHLMSHLFQVQDSYFLVLKSVSKIQKVNKKSSFFNLFKTSQINLQRSFQYLLIKMQNSIRQNKEGHSKIVINLQINSEHPTIKKLLLTIFLNFCFVDSYWKKQQLNQNKIGNILPVSHTLMAKQDNVTKKGMNLVSKTESSGMIIDNIGGTAQSGKIKQIIKDNALKQSYANHYLFDINWKVSKDLFQDEKYDI